MTDRIKGLIVTLAEDIRADDALAIIHAIQMIKGVLFVEPSVRDGDDLMNRRRIQAKLEAKLYAALQDEQP